MKKPVFLITMFLIALAVFSGCTGPSGSPVPEPVQTTLQKTIVAVETSAMVNESLPVTTVVPMITTNPPQTVPFVSFTINSAEKRDNIYGMKPKIANNVFLILNITVKNNNIEKGYEFSDQSVTVASPDNIFQSHASATMMVRGGLNNPIITPTTIQKGDQRTGQIVFGVPAGSNTYKIALYDNKGAETSSETITV